MSNVASNQKVSSDQPSEVLFREVLPNDIPSVLEMIADSEVVQLPLWEDHDFLVRAIERQPGLSAVAIRNEKIVGCVFAGDDGFRVMIHHLFVEPNCRCVGLGKNLLAYVIEKIRDYSGQHGGPQRVIGTFLNQNSAMKSICESLHFELIEETLFQCDL